MARCAAPIAVASRGSGAWWDRGSSPATRRCWRWPCWPGCGRPGRRARGTAVAILATVTVFALVSYGVEARRAPAAPAPAAVTVNGKPYPIGHGKFFLFFFNPACSHCAEAARRMARLDWRDATVIAVPIEQPQFAGQFLDETGLRAVVSTDFQKLRHEVGYTSYPYGVALEDGRQKARLTGFDAPEPEAALRRLGFVQ